MIDAFEFGARVLKISVEGLLQLYEVTIDVLLEGIKAGRTNPNMGLQALMGYFDLLHGGAYACPINQLPHYAPVMDKSIYYAGDLRNKPIMTWLAWLAQNTAGENATDMMCEVLEDANAPHVFPKLLSDPMYAQLKLSFAQSMSMEFFSTATTGVSTLVEGVGTGIGRAAGGLSKVGVGQGGEEGYSEASIQRLLALLPKAVG